ncbi:MAG: hypothetical protein HY088_07725 [Ignavibacteriales bacterium]|nr:hypothetical protein [Ignavibacteriales bacterium]
MANKEFVIGIDGGGTKTAAILADLQGNVIVEETAGASNFQVMGVEKAADVLLNLIRKCCKEADCSVADVQCVVAGLTGAGRDSDKKQISDRLFELAKENRITLNKVVIESDARIALEGAFRGGAGIILIAGTGSIAFAKDLSGAIYRTGGWGRILGDEGGGYAIGRDGLNAVTRHLDGRGKETLLTKLIAKEFGLSSQEKIITAVYREQFDIASVAPLVIEAAQKEDAECARLLNKATFELSEHVRALIKKIEKSSRVVRKIPLAFIGSVITSDTVFTKILANKITFSLPQISIVKAQTSPVHGAVLMAIQTLKETV